MDAYAACHLCPRTCGADRLSGGVGACGVGAQTLVARVGLHEWEEPPLSGQTGSGTIFFSGCSLGCSYCQNAAISRGCAGQPMTVGELAEACLGLQEAGAMNVNMVTPTHFAPSIREAISLARTRGLGLPVVWNTSGYETVDAIRANAGSVDTYLTDMKYADTRLGSALSRVRDYPEVALAAIGEMVAQVGAPAYDEYHGCERMARGVVVRHMVIPGHADDSIEVVRLLHERFGSDVRLSLMSQYTPVLATAAEAGSESAQRCLREHPELGRSLDRSEYERVLDAADGLGVRDYFWQDGDAASESFIPDFSG